MGIITTEVEVKLSTKSVEYYKNLGYEIKMKPASKTYQKVYNKNFVYDFTKPILVKIEDLQKGSKIKVRVLCDMCKVNEMNVSYNTYNRVINNSSSYVCKDCAVNKQINTTQQRYGFNAYSCTDEFKERIIQKSREKFGCDNVSQSNEIKSKKAHTFYNNSSQKSSRQQRYICELYSGILNYPVKYYSGDIYLPDDNIICEFDGSGHLLNVKAGRETLDEYNHKELIRSQILKREGYKQMRLISATDKLPSDQTLLQLLSYARKYFSEYPNHSWINFSIDTSQVFNAENKEGIFFNYGELHRLKQSA